MSSILPDPALLGSVDWLSGLIIGLFSSVTHCVGMCGGIANALALGIRGDRRRQYLYNLGYNLGRITSYSCAGMLAGFFGASITTLSSDAVGYLRLFSAVMIITIGLYISKWWLGLKHIERLGSGFWRLFKPLNQYIFPVDSLYKALGYGLIWGWLPCGLVYSTLTLSLASGSTLQGGLIMFSFGMGTLPVMLTLGLMMSKVQSWFNHPGFRQIAGSTLIFWGLYNIYLFSYVVI